MADPIPIQISQQSGGQNAVSETATSPDLSNLNKDASTITNKKYPADISLVNLPYVDGDVVRNYDWTQSDVSVDVVQNNIPKIILTEYEQDLASIFAQISYWYNNAIDKLDPENPYKNLYHAKPTGMIFNLPYFEQYNHNTTQEWQKNAALLEAFGGFGNLLINLFGKIKMALGNAPGMNVNQPRSWGGSSPISYPVTFTLLNTKTQDAWKKNKLLIDRLIMSSLHNQKSAILASPPAIFEVEVMGIRNSPASVIANISVVNKGQINLIDKVNVPDAWEITLTILELITESRQIFKYSASGTSKVKAINEGDLIGKK
jgi:hypothetical protein